MAFPALFALLGRLGGGAATGGGLGSLLGGLGGGGGAAGVLGQMGGIGGRLGRVGSLIENVGAAGKATPTPLPYQGTAFKPKPFSMKLDHAAKENARFDAHQASEAKKKAAHDQKELGRTEKEAGDKAHAAGRAIGQMRDMVAGVPKPADLASQALAKVVGKFKEVVGHLAAPLAAIQEIGDTLGAFTSKSNPGQFARFTLVMNDAFASLGRGLEPLMEFVIRLGTFAGDMFSKFSPVLAALSRAVAKFGDALLAMYRRFYAEVLTALKPAIDLFIFLLDEIAPVVMRFNPVLGALRMGLEGLGRALLIATYPIRKLQQLLQSLGVIGKGGFDPDASAKGNAAQTFTISDSANDFQRDLAVKALSSTGPQDKTPDEALVEIPSILTDIFNLLKTGLPGMLKDAAVAFGKELVPFGGSESSKKSLTGAGVIENANPMIALVNAFRMANLR